MTCAVGRENDGEIAGFPSGPAIGDELGVAGLVAAFVGVQVKECGQSVRAHEVSCVDCGRD